MEHAYKVTQVPGNLPQFRWMVECTCGWQGRFGQEVNAKSAGASHVGVQAMPTLNEINKQEPVPLAAKPTGAESVDVRKLIVPSTQQT